VLGKIEAGEVQAAEDEMMRKKFQELEAGAVKSENCSGTEVPGTAKVEDDGPQRRGRA
jgi:hypothetical protein